MKIGLLAGLLVRVWLATLRVRVVRDPALCAAEDRPWVLAFWHGAEWPLMAWKRRRPTIVLVSLSRDGSLLAGALRVLGIRVARGSSSRGGAAGLAQIVHVMRRDCADGAFAVDGPRGPKGIAKRGALVAARATGGVVVPMAGVVRRGFVFGRTWDRFAVAWPFTRVDVALGGPIDPKRDDAHAQVQAALVRLNTDLA